MAAVAGRADLLDLCAGPVLHGGTYNAQPVTMAATVATLRSLTPGLFDRIAGNGTRLMEGPRRILSDAGVTATVTGFPQIFHVALSLEAPARDYRDLLAMNRPAYVSLASELLHHGVRVLERGAWFLSSEHGTDVIDETLDIASHAVSTLRCEGKL